MNPEIKDKWRNYPAPPVPSSLLKMIADVGGRIPLGCGEFSERPMFELVWGMDAREWKNGKNRIRFLARQRANKQFFGLRRDFYAQMLEWIQAEEARLFQAYQSLNLPVAYSAPELSTFIQGKGINGVDYIRIDSSKSFDDINAELALRDFVFVADVAEIEQIGKPYWYLLGYMPSPQISKDVCPFMTTMLDTESEWNGARYGVGFYPETRETRTLDLLGEYPKNGGYFREFLVLRDDNHPDRYIAPTEENIIAPIREYIRQREEVTQRWHNDPELRAQATLDEILSEWDAETLAWEIEFEERFDDAVPAFDAKEFVTVL